MKKGFYTAGPQVGKIVAVRMIFLLMALLLPITAAVAADPAAVADQDSTQAVITDPAARRRAFFEDLKMLGDVYDRIINNYVDVLDPHEVMVGAIEGMLDELDEHSNYLPPVNYEDLMTSTEGEFGGLGITIQVRDHYPTVVSPIEGTPAYYMGIQGGDQIIKIEGESSKDLTSTQAVKKLRGPPGTAVNITIGRPGREDPIPLTITRDIIKIESVPYAFMMGDIGYIRIQTFARTTASEVRSKLEMLTDQGMRGLILDLRFNPGGLLDAAKGVSELFLDRGKLIVSTKGRLSSQDLELKSEARGKVYNNVPMVVLVNGSSASASEIVSAAIQDHDAGLVVGQTSFGKGSVQTIFRMDPDEAMKLTTARYYTPSGRSIHKDRPRHPRIGGEGPAKIAHPLQKAPADREKARFEKQKYYTDSGRVVYGGGGITPDIEIDQDLLTDFEIVLVRDSALFSFAVEFLAKQDTVPEDFHVDDEVFGEFKDFLKGRENIPEYLEDFELTLSDSLLDANRVYIDRGIRREVARRRSGSQAAYQVAIEADVQLHHALDLFKKAHTLPELLDLAKQWNQEQLEKHLAAAAADSAAAVADQE